MKEDCTLRRLLQISGAVPERRVAVARAVELALPSISCFGKGLKEAAGLSEEEDMRWTKVFPTEPKTIWWTRVKFGDGSASQPTVTLVKEHERYGIIYRFIGELESWTREEMEDDGRKNGYDVEFLGPITPMED